MNLHLLFLKRVNLVNRASHITSDYTACNKPQCWLKVWCCLLINGQHNYKHKEDRHQQMCFNFTVLKLDGHTLKCNKVRLYPMLSYPVTTITSLYFPLKVTEISNSIKISAKYRHTLYCSVNTGTFCLNHVDVFHLICSS